MSMTLLLWKAPVGDDPDEAKVLLAPYYETGDESAFAPSPDIARVREEILRRYPDDGSGDDSSPWADYPPEESDRILALHIRWGADNAVLDAIVELARQHDLVLYDPQGPAVHKPAGPYDEARPPTLGEYVQATVAGTVCALFAVGAWIVSIPVLSWIVIAAGGFMALMALYSLVVFARHSVFGFPPPR